MEFEWDEQKRLANIEKHGVDFTLAVTIFADTIVTKEDARVDYGSPSHLDRDRSKWAMHRLCLDPARNATADHIRLERWPR